MAYRVEFKTEALAEIERLSPTNQERVLRKIRWLGDHFEQLTPQALTGNLSGLFKLRIGDYRSLYSFNDETELITIHRIGHRSGIYL
ncbi:type II toxin-antitoxin system RelE family toxin [Stenomitos frigidus]|uniref:Type II toxin-antitoxin system mRNA interferase toxin, RelE/StbE family n=1 Tax=Stenomitos frigidus ULC18 TaxID=2107698 RepID=A0A2T1DTE6_9CYAN|nr:type II toxin-antitoxin system RelE/ParE family toxin [Stenomitos frigidus]PSB23767.1 type II toxin-antitoxin system mRNA interferase toxin, RelE/StbE family [Stenomitos frigidus ULC18]